MSEEIAGGAIFHALVVNFYPCHTFGIVCSGGSRWGSGGSFDPKPVFVSKMF